MVRPKLHNDETERSTRGRPGRESTASTKTDRRTGPAQTRKEDPQTIPPSDIDSFLAIRTEEQKKEPMRTITLKMPESVFQRFEKARGSMTKTSYILSLVEFAEKNRTHSL